MALTLPKYSIGTGDRFGRQGEAQLRAVALAQEHLDDDLAIVWNKSNREHQICCTEPSDVRKEADAAVESLKWYGPYFADADHIGLTTIDRFIDSSDFFTIDVAQDIGIEPIRRDLDIFFGQNSSFFNGVPIIIEGIEPIRLSKGKLLEIANKYLSAINAAAATYDYIRMRKGEGTFITEVSMDETDKPQTPAELFFILKCLAMRHVPVQTIAPKFTGKFHKGTEYVGDTEQFRRDLAAHLAVVRHVTQTYDLPKSLKLSIHSGSDKFSLYPIIREELQKARAGLHLKTAGTTWLAELEGLIEMGSHSLRLVKNMYPIAYQRFDELCAPYRAVIDIDYRKLPKPEVVENWTKTQFLAALENNPQNPEYNPHLRQFLHVAYKVAAEPRFQAEYLQRVSCDEVRERVTNNLYEKHLKQLFVGGR